MAHAVDESSVATESRLTLEGELIRRITVEDSLSLVRVLGLVAAARDAKEICASLVERGLFGRPLELCALARYDSERDGLELMGCDGLVRSRLAERTLSASASTPMTDALRRDTMVEVCDDAALGARYPDVEHGTEVDRVLVALPVRVSDRIVGVFGARWARRSELSNNERAMLVLLAARLGPVVERCAALERERREIAEREAGARRFHAMARISRELAEAGFDERELLERAARGIADVFGDSCLIRMDPSGRSDAIARQDEHPVPRAELERIVKESGLSTPQDGVLVRRAHARTRGVRLRKAGAVRASMSAPIAIRGAACGVMLVLRHRKEAFTDADRLLLEDVSYRVGLALAAARAFASAEEAREKAERAARGRDRMLSAVTHDLRAPLATVHLGTSLLVDTHHDEEAFADIVNRIGRATGRMRRLVEDLVDLGQLESGVLRVRRGRVPLAAMLADTADELQERARAAQKQLACSPPPEPIEVLGDLQRLQQVLVNLIVNAIDHTPPGTWIVLGGELRGERASIWVEDDGPGISPELAEHLFEPYVRGSRATAHGAGLGLWIAKGIVEAHGAELKVISAPGEGTRFELEMNVAKNDD